MSAFAPAVLPVPGATGIPAWLTVLIATACGLIAANIYLAQPLVGPIAASLGLSAAMGGLIPTMTQLGYGAGLLLIAPLGDLVENRRLILSALCLAILALASAALSTHAAPFLLASMLVGLGSVAVQILVPVGKGGKMFPQAFRIHRSGEDRRARAEEADVDRAMEMLGVEVGAETACILADVRSLRRRLDALLDDLLPPVSRPGLGKRLLRWTGLTLRARAADAALVALFHGASPDPRCLALCSIGCVRALGERVSPEEAMRGRIADALDDAYCMMLPHEAARRAELHRAFWASAQEEDRKRKFIGRCSGRSD